MEEVAAATDQHEVEATEEDDVKVMVEVDETAVKNECDESVKVKECDGEGEIIPSSAAADKKINSLDELYTHCEQLVETLSYLFDHKCPCVIIQEPLVGSADVHWVRKLSAI